MEYSFSVREKKNPIIGDMSDGAHSCEIVKRRLPQTIRTIIFKAELRIRTKKKGARYNRRGNKRNCN